MITGKAPEVAAALRVALRSVDGVRHEPDQTSVEPPATVLGPPVLAWAGYGDEPTSITFTAYLVVKRDDRALEELLRWLPPVAAAIDNTEVAAVTDARPGTYSSSGADLPCYELTITA